MTKRAKILAVIPARYGSTRFPGKALAKIAGKPLLEHLYFEISRSKYVDKVVVGTDSEEIFKAVENFGGEAIYTSSKNRTGSDRSAEVMKKLGGEIIVSIQADHLGLKSSDYDRVFKAMLIDSKIKYATLIKKIDDPERLFDPNRVKVILDKNQDALWFSRFPLPYLQSIEGNHLRHFTFYYHIGVYFFRKKGLSNYNKWPQGKFELAESLEQLRILENHEKIRVFHTNSTIFSIDTPEDLKRLKKHILK
jgi:3-deoxy-manno-octulosonate cytidylyltransferase (CMP-KDO synthetase)